MKKLINGKQYDFPQEVVEYIDELEYYHNFTLGKRVIEIHYGLTGNIRAMFNNFYEIPDDILPEKNEFFKSLKVTISEGHKALKWFVVEDERNHNFYCYPFSFWRIMPPLEDNEVSDEDDEEIEGDYSNDDLFISFE